MLYADAGATGWLTTFSKKEFWKVAHIFDELEDLTQEGQVCWYTVANKYEHITDYGHLMGLFKTTFRNHIRYLATMDKDQSYAHMVSSISDYAPSWHSHEPESWILDTFLNKSPALVQTTDTVEEVSRFIAEAIDPVRSVLKFLTSDKGIAAMRRPYRRRLSGRRETTNERICRHLGVAPKVDLLGMTKRYIAEAM